VEIEGGEKDVREKDGILFLDVADSAKKTRSSTLRKRWKWGNRGEVLEE